MDAAQSFEFLLLNFAIGDVLEKNQQAVGRGVDTLREPAIPGRKVALRTNGHPLRDGPAVGQFEGRADGFRENVLVDRAQELSRRAPEYFDRAQIDIGKSHIAVHGDEPNSHTLKDAAVAGLTSAQGQLFAAALNGNSSDMRRLADQFELGFGGATGPSQIHCERPQYPVAPVKDGR